MLASVPRNPISLFQLFSASISNPPSAIFSPKLRIFNAPLDGGVKPLWIPPNKLILLNLFINPNPGSKTDVVLSKYVDPAKRSILSCSKISYLSPGLKIKLPNLIDSEINADRAVDS